LKNLETGLRASDLFSRALPVFRLGSVKSLNPRDVNKFLLKCCRDLALKGKIFSAKSFRAGLPSDLENCPEPLSTEQVKALGRWSSGAYKVYMKDKRSERKWVFRKICKSLMG